MPVCVVVGTLIAPAARHEVRTAGSQHRAGVQAEGVKSKRHMKAMLQDLKQRGWVTTRTPPADSARRDRAFRYLLTNKAKPTTPSTSVKEVAR